MPKRTTMSRYNEQSCKKKRRRYRSLSPARERDEEIENATKIMQLMIEVQILKAQVTVLQRQLKDLCQTQPTGQLRERDQVQHSDQKDKNNNCILM